MTPACWHCGTPVTGTPVTDVDDPLNRTWCSEDHLEASAEQAGGACADIEYSAGND